MSSYTCSCCHTEFETTDDSPLDYLFYDINFDEGFFLCYNCAESMPVYFEYDEEYEYSSGDNDLDYYPDVIYDDYTYIMYAN